MENRRSWDREEIQFIKDNYGKYQVQQMASMMSRSISSISHKISKLGLDDPRCWTADEDRLLIENYEYNPDVWNIFPGRSRATITVRANSYGLSRKCGNYNVNWRFFDNETPDMAYVLGFITADGCVEPNLNRISISQNKNDVQILYDIRSAMKCDNPICYKNNRNETGLYIHNKHIVDILCDIGIGYKKTYRTIFPSLDGDNESHFIRGVFDGDGSIYSDKYHAGRIQFLGSRKLLSQIRIRMIEIGCNSKPEPRKRQVNTHILSYGRSYDIFAVYKYFYFNSGLRLNRKFNTYTNIIKAMLNKEPSLEEKSLEEFIQLKSGNPGNG